MTATLLIKLDNLFLKREDQNITGSAKDRAISFQVENLKKQGIKEAVISSTGNAAISALHFCRLNGIKLVVFVSPKIDKHKLELLQKNSCDIHFSSKAISDAFKYSKSHNAFFLRQSTDPNALIGYQNIGKELQNQLPEVTSIFVPVGSGTTLLGISKSLNPNIKLFAVQPAAHCPIAKLFDKNYSPEDEAITDAISVNLLPLKDRIVKELKAKGGAFVVQNKEILDASIFLENHNIKTSYEGALALAGFFKASKAGIDTGKNPVIILTGAQR
jgi:threonine synthase